MMNKFLKNEYLASVNFGIVLYFLFLQIVNFYQLSFLILGVITELFTIPFLISIPIVLLLNFKNVIAKKANWIGYLSFILLIICTGNIINSFIS